MLLILDHKPNRNFVAFLNCVQTVAIQAVVAQLRALFVQPQFVLGVPNNHMQTVAVHALVAQLHALFVQPQFAVGVPAHRLQTVVVHAVVVQMLLSLLLSASGSGSATRLQVTIVVRDRGYILLITTSQVKQLTRHNNVQLKTLQTFQNKR